MKATTITTDPIHVPFLRQAYQAAHIKSDDPDTHNGAVLVDVHGKVLVPMANSIPFGIKVLPNRLKRPTKYTYIEHAERNAIYLAARKGEPLGGATLYAPWAACIECARAIIESGIRRVVVHKAMMDKTPKRWRASIETALQMFDEARIEILFYDGKIGGVEARFDGENWAP